MAAFLLTNLGLVLPASAQTTYTPYAVTTLAGSPGTIGTNDGIGANALFRNPSAAAVDHEGNVYVADTANDTIRKVSPAGVVTTLAGLAKSCGASDGAGSTARFCSPFGVAVDNSGNIYVADTGNLTIRKVTPGGVVTTLAGLTNNPGGADGTGSAARFTSPVGVAVDSSGNVYVADNGNHTIRKVAPVGTNWVVTTVAGSAGSSGTANGTNNTARFNQPFGIAVDGAGNIYVADDINSTIRKVAPAGTNWVVTTPVGLALNPGVADGTNSDARFYFPTGVAADDGGNVYVSDIGTQTIRKMSPSGTNWVVTTLAGLPYTNGIADGTGSAVRFNSPMGVAVDGGGNVYVADRNNHTIRKSVILWTNTAGGNWSSPTNWSGSVVPATGANVAMTANGTYTVNLDTNVSVASLAIGGTSGRQTLVVTNGKSYLGKGGTVIGGGGSTGVVTIASGTFIATNFPVYIGPMGSGLMTISAGGQATLGEVLLGGSSTNASGELDVLTGGHLTVLSNASANFIVIGGGDLDGSGGTVIIGENHDASMLVSSGSATNIGTLFVGYSAGFTGAFTQSGGLVTVKGNVIVGANNSTGIVSFSSGTMYVTNATHTAALDVRKGSFVMSGGTLIVDRLITTNGAAGTIVRTGGTLVCGGIEQSGNGVTITNNLVVGQDSNSAGGVTALGGGSQLFVTNTAHNAVMEVRNGTFVLDPGGLMVVDKLVITNASGHFIKNGGTLVAGSIILAPNLDADNDSQSNTNEMRAGTDPLDPTSSFQAVGVVRTNAQDLRLDWTVVGGKSYVVQWAPGGLGGSAPFVDLSSVITVPGTGNGKTNYVHLNGATTGIGFYRVRLAP